MADASGCEFCRIAAGEADAYRVYEDEATVAFLDANPAVDAHVLVAPKRHVEDVLTVGVGEVSEQAEALMEATLAALFAGIAEMSSGQRSGDVSSAIQNVVEEAGFNVVREYTGHGVGRNMHEDPQVPNYGQASTGLQLKPGLTVALEPMVLAGGSDTRVLKDPWTVASRDGGLTAHFEHTVAVTEDGPWILTALDEDDLDEGLGVRYNQYFGGRRESAFGTVQGG
jgi:diadenosine tetraphosphate (Ap4A) HIT family hydrolase